MENFIEKLFEVYLSHIENSYLHLEDTRDIQLVSFTYGIIFILEALKINAEKIDVKNSNLKEHLNYIVSKYLKTDIELTNEEKLNDFLYD